MVIDVDYNRLRLHRDASCNALRYNSPSSRIIGFDGSRAFAGRRTGTENYSYQLLKNLAKIDKVNNYIVYLRPAAKQGNDWPGNFQFQVINWPRFWTQGGLALRTFKDCLDVLFVPAHTLPVIRRPGLKTVVTVHDLGSEYLPSMHQIKQRVYLSFMQKYQLKTATKIIAVSKATKDNLVKKIGIDPGKIEVIYEGYDQNLFKQVKNDSLVNSLRHYNSSSLSSLRAEGLQPKTYVSAKQKGKVLPKAGSYFLFVGTVQPRKNLERLIMAFKIFCHSGAKRSEAIESRSYKQSLSARLQLADRSASASLQDDNLKLVIAGSKGWLSDEIYELPKKLGIEEQVKFLGYVAEEVLSALYSGALALTFPSLFEGFGLPILEAQACGCPVLTSNVSSMPEVAGTSAGGGAIFVDPYSIDDIVKGMVEITNKDTKRRVIEAGFLNIKKFSWEKCARETLEVFHDFKS